MTLLQARKIEELVNKGYVVLGPSTPTVGGPTLMQAPDSKKYTVNSAGDVTRAPDDAKPAQVKIS